MTDEGIPRVEEAGNWPGSMLIEGGVKELRKILIGRDPVDVERLWAYFSGGQALNASVWRFFGGKG